VRNPVLKGLKSKSTDWGPELVASLFIPLVNRRVHLAGVRGAGHEAGTVSSLISRGLQSIVSLHKKGLISVAKH
jgi:hypothetical protein